MPGVADRLEVRLDAERRKKLEEMAKAGAGPLSEITRHGIDLAYEEFMLERRLEAVRRISELNIEDMPDPDELSRQMAERYGPLS
jgi:hypothetical protein